MTLTKSHPIDAEHDNFPLLWLTYEGKNKNQNSMRHYVFRSKKQDNKIINNISMLLDNMEKAASWVSKAAESNIDFSKEVDR